MSPKQLAKTSDRQVANASPAAAAAEQPQQPTRAPNMTIYETDQAVVVIADMPGVTQNGIDITVDADVLTVRGAVAPMTHNGFRLRHREYQEANFERSLTMPPEIDVEQVKASVKNGVVTLTLPKNKAVQSRRSPSPKAQPSCSPHRTAPHRTAPGACGAGSARASPARTPQPSRTRNSGEKDRPWDTGDPSSDHRPSQTST